LQSQNGVVSTFIFWTNRRQRLEVESASGPLAPPRLGERRHRDLASDHSITSSARASKVGGTSRPSALAVCASATSQFNVQDAIAQANALKAQLDAANAREVSARLAASSEIDGENTNVAQLIAQLDNAQWKLEQTTVRAPSDGYVTGSTLVVGDRAVITNRQCRSSSPVKLRLSVSSPRMGFRR
jgi:multidrug resistance efflux pump